MSNNGCFLIDDRKMSNIIYIYLRNILYTIKGIRSNMLLRVKGQNHRNMMTQS